MPASDDKRDEKFLYRKYLKSADKKRRKRQGTKKEWHELPRLDIPRLTQRVLPHVVDSPSSKHRKIFMRELAELSGGNEYELHSRDDRVCAKTFSDPLVLKTLTGLDAYSFGLAKEARRSGGRIKIDMISETGEWLLAHGKDFRRYMQEADEIRLIVAFLCDVPKLYKHFGHNIKIAYQQPWHHNRHMAILHCDGEPKQAIYFARHHRTPYVTPVLARRRGDIGVLQTTFDARWRNATRLEQH